MRKEGRVGRGEKVRVVMMRLDGLTIREESPPWQ